MIAIFITIIVAVVLIFGVVVWYLYGVTESLNEEMKFTSRLLDKQQDYIGIIFDRIIAIEKRELERKKDEYGVLSKSSKSHDEQTGEEAD